eukprot:SAG31_NODE_38079_length_299_cov_0.770000_1_plen_52_part_01
MLCACILRTNASEFRRMGIYLAVPTVAEQFANMAAMAMEAGMLRRGASLLYV